jgi:hypothetical protein
VDVIPGSRWQSVACTTQVVVVRPPSAPVELRCGGHPMVPLAADHEERLLLPDLAGGTPTGKRFFHDATGLEVLCTHGGDGTLAVGDQPLARRDAKPLPSSD